MIPWEHLDTASMPGGGGDLHLKRRGAEYSILAGAEELMNSRLFGSEEALATLAWDRIKPRPNPAILIGGLGMGFTLRAALAALPADARITVAELVPAVITWARGPLAGLFAGSLEDPRVTLRTGDVSGVISAARAAYDAVLLDVDNGPQGHTRRENDRLYSRAGLAQAKAALTPAGVLAVWSSGPDARFTERLAASGFAVEEVRVRATRSGRGARHNIWLAIPNPSEAPRS